MNTEFLPPFTLSWPEGVFPLGSDTLALGNFATVRRSWKVCDLGCGSGALLLLLKRRDPSLSLFGVDLDPISAQTAQANLLNNHLEGIILTADLRGRELPSGQFDLVISNPPYFALHTGKSGGQARSEETCTLDQLCSAASRATKNGGRFALCHRPERLTDLLSTLRHYGLEPKRMQLVAHSAIHAPFLVMVESVRQGKPGLEVLPTLIP